MTRAFPLPYWCFGRKTLPVCCVSVGVPYGRELQNGCLITEQAPNRFAPYCLKDGYGDEDDGDDPKAMQFAKMDVPEEYMATNDEELVLKMEQVRLMLSCVDAQ